MSVRFYFEPRDLWVGVYWAWPEADIYRPYVFYRVYICLLPTLCIRISWQREVESFKRFKRERRPNSGFVGRSESLTPEAERLLFGKTTDARSEGRE